MWLGNPHAHMLGEVPQAAGGGVPVESGAASIEQDRPATTSGITCMSACLQRFQRKSPHAELPDVQKWADVTGRAWPR